jgi:hypothetical protein
MENLAIVYGYAGRITDAVPMMEDALQRARQLSEPRSSVAASIRRSMAATYDLAGHFAKSESLYREFVQAARQQFGENDPQTAAAMAQLGANLLRQEKFIEAEPLLRQCLVVREELQPTMWTTFNTRSLLGASLLGQRKFAEAEPLLLDSYKRLKDDPAVPPPDAFIGDRRREALERIAKLYDAWNAAKADRAYELKAVRWRVRLAEYDAQKTQGAPPAPPP